MLWEECVTLYFFILFASLQEYHVWANVNASTTLFIGDAAQSFEYTPNIYIVIKRMDI